MLVLLAGYFGDPADPRLIPGSVSIELVHLATLYHDDVIDEADARRGAPSANVRWDNTVAILTGDYLFARASEISTDLGVEVCRLLARTIAVLCDGQIREVDSSGLGRPADRQLPRDHPAQDRPSLIATSCRLGGMLSDAEPEHVDILEEFGDALGMAYQLSDDIMDITSTQMELGKEPGQDLQGGRLHAAGPRTRWPTTSTARSSRAILGHGPPDGEMLDRALEIVRTGGSDRPCAAGGHGRGRACDGPRAPPPRGPRAARVGPARAVPGGAVRRGAGGVSALLESGRSRNLSQT